MINSKNNRGITLVMLVVTIIVMFIIAGITITLSVESLDQTIETQDESEMRIIQHAMFERYIEYLETGNEELFVGTRNKDGKYIISETKNLTDIIADIPYPFLLIVYNAGIKKITFYDNNKNEIGYEYITKESDMDDFIEQLGEENKLENGDSNYISHTTYKIEKNEFENIYLKNSISDFEKLGVTGQSIINSVFIVDYVTGYVIKEGLDDSKALKEYNKDINGNITSNMINID